MKKWLTVSFALILIFALTACGSSGNGTSKSGGNGNQKVTLTFWQFGSTGYEDLAKQYEASHPNIKIQFKTSEQVAHHNALFTAISAGSGAPDIAMIDTDFLDKFRPAQDKFYNMYDLGFDKLKDQYLPWKLKLGSSTDGKFLFGVPTDIGPKALYYRTDVFAAAGLPTDPDQVAALIDTPDKFKQVGLQIKQKTGKPMLDSMEMAYRAKLDTLPVSYFDKSGNLVIDQPNSGVKQAFDYAVELNKLGLVGKYTMWTPEWGNAINKGDFAAEIGAAWLKGWMEGNAPDAKGKFRVASLPTAFQGNWGGSFLTIPKQTKHAKEAYDFITWLESPQNQLNSFKAQGLFPSAPAVYDMEAFKNATDDFFGGQATQNVFAKATQNITSSYKGPDYATVHTDILDALTNVQQKGEDPQKAWNDAVKKAKADINR